MKSDNSGAGQPGFFDVFKSVSASFFGVQSDEVRRRDFEHGKPSHFIVMGLILTVAFVLGIWGITLLVLKLAGV